MSSNFVKIFEIGSDVPIVSTSPPKNKKKPLALTLTIEKKRIRLATGVPSIVRKNFSVDKDGKYDLTSLHNYLLNLKRANPDERNVILIPKTNLNYEALVEIMDSIRMIQRTDESIYVKQKDGNEKRVKTLFDNIVFGNLLS
jgi:biopolymer transport protein ExbD